MPMQLIELFKFFEWVSLSIEVIIVIYNDKYDADCGDDG